MFVLAIDTSSPAVTAGVAEIGARPADCGPPTDVPTLLAASTSAAPRGHGELLAPAIVAVLTQARIGVGDLGAIVVGTGPGPYTGLRVGLVTAAVMADTLGVPAYGVCSLDAIGDACADEADLVVATDARRREVYWARYRHGRRLGEPGVDRPAEVPLDGIGALAGAGAALYADVWPERRLRAERHPEPLALVRAALDRVVGGAPADPLTPLYLRRPDAVAPGGPKRVTA